jgi:hypothetical protein
MRHSASASFWDLYENLPSSIRELADKNFSLLKTNLNHPSLHLKKLGKYWTVRVGRKHRVVGVEMDEGILWFWIGKHSEYDKLIEAQ